jgi:octaprenyl-diphosphate synthase
MNYNHKIQGMLRVVGVHDSITQVVTSELEQIVQIFDRQLASDSEGVNQLCCHIKRYRGKMLRPTLLVLCGLAAAPHQLNNGTLNGRHRKMGAVVEMIHMATLVHDDILDSGEVRRGNHTVNYLQGNEMALMLGDYLIASAFRLCNSLGDPDITETVCASTNAVFEGELIQLQNRGRVKLPKNAYCEIIGRKTAALMGLCCRLGGRLSGADETVVQAMGQFGENLGMAFQIQDDILDFIGISEILGKSLGRDLAEGKMTLPIILHFAHSSPGEGDRLLKAIKECDSPSVLKCLQDSGAFDSARAQAEAYVARARFEISALPESIARDALVKIAGGMVNREC